MRYRALRNVKTDLKLVRELGLRYLRYGPPIYRIWLGPGKYDWSALDPVMSEIRRLGIVPIVDLVHFGLLIGSAIFRT